MTYVLAVLVIISGQPVHYSIPMPSFGACHAEAIMLIEHARIEEIPMQAACLALVPRETGA